MPYWKHLRLLSPHFIKRKPERVSFLKPVRVNEIMSGRKNPNIRNVSVSDVLFNGLIEGERKEFSKIRVRGDGSGEDECSREIGFLVAQVMKLLSASEPDRDCEE